MKRRRKTNNSPFLEDELFKEACKMCEAYAGDDHYYEGECNKCPIYRMAKRHAQIKAELDHMKYVKSWEGVQDMGS